MIHAAALLAALALAQAATPAARAVDLAGKWTIEKAVLAPWADAKVWGPDHSTEKRLIGKTVSFGDKAVTAPGPLGCAKPIYTVRDDPPDMLFEGGLAEDAHDKPADAGAAAKALGMPGPTVRTWETGCSEMLFHRFGPDTILFALDNRIFTMRRGGKP